MEILSIMGQSQIIALITHTIITLTESIWFCIIINTLITMKYLFQPNIYVLQMTIHHHLQVAMHHQIQPIILQV